MKISRKFLEYSPEATESFKTIRSSYTTSTTHQKILDWHENPIKGDRDLYYHIIRAVRKKGVGICIQRSAISWGVNPNSKFSFCMFLHAIKLICSPYFAILATKQTNFPAQIPHRITRILKYIQIPEAK